MNTFLLLVTKRCVMKGDRTKFFAKLAISNEH